MKKLILIILVFISFFTNEVQAQEKADYNVSVFYEYGWYYCTLVNNSNITILCYSNKNDYQKKVNPYTFYKALLELQINEILV